MDGTTQLVLLLAAIYLSDCVAWIRRGSLALRSIDGRRFRAALPSRGIGNARAGLVWTSPLPPLGTLFLSEPWPFAVSPEGVATSEPLELELGPRAPFRARAWSWDEIAAPHANGREILFGSEVVARASSERAALHAAELVATLRELEPRARAAAIESELARSFDSAAVLDTAERFARETRILRAACNALFSICAVIVPGVLLYFGLARTWPWLLALLLGTHVLAVLLAGRVRGRLRPEERPSRLPFFASLALSPPQAVRALDLLARPMLATFHPLAAAILLPADERERIARSTAIDLRHPRRPGDGDERAEASAAWFRARALAAAERCAASLALDWAQILPPPPAEREPSKSYCPRCQLQFDLVDTICPDCTCASAPLAASVVEEGSRALVL